MKKFLTLAVAASVMALTTGTATFAADSGSERARIKAAPVQKLQLKATPTAQQNSQVPFNEAPAWTAGCYAEFGPNASNPDPKLLQICLDK